VKGRRSGTPLIWLLTRAALLAAVWAAAVALMRRLRRRRRPAPEAVLEAIPVTPSYAGGAGTPLVLLHGVGGTWRVWRPVLPLLERWHAVFAPTLPGHCGADRLPAGVAPSIDALADGVAEQLDRAGIDRAHIVGNSLGGWIALELARRGRARSVVLFGPAGAWRSAARMTAVATGLRLSFVLLARQAGRAEAIARRRRARRLLLATQVEHPDRVDPAEFAASIRAMKDSPVVAPLLRVITKHPLEHLPRTRPARSGWSGRSETGSSRSSATACPCWNASRAPRSSGWPAWATSRCPTTRSRSPASSWRSPMPLTAPNRTIARCH